MKKNISIIIEEGRKLKSGSPLLLKIEPKYKKVNQYAYDYIFFGVHPE